MSAFSRCPLCKMQITVADGHSESLPSHVMIQQLQEMVKSMDESQGNVSACLICKKENHLADKFCKECETTMCGRCCKKHKKKPQFKDHHLLAKVLVLCCRHELQFVKFCSDCSRFLCEICLVDSDCRNHHVQFIPDATDAKLSELDRLIDSIIDDIEYSRQKAQPLMNMIQYKLESTLRIKKAIEKHTKKIIAKAKLREKELLKELDAWQEQLVDIQNEEPTTDTNALESLLKTAFMAKESSNEKILLTVPAIKSRLPKVTKEEEPLVVQHNLIFEKDDSLYLGRLRKVSHAVSEYEEVATMKPQNLLWQAAENMEKSEVSAVAFTSNNSVVICDDDNKDVKMYDSQGNLVATTKQSGITFGNHVCGLAYDAQNRTVIVAAGSDGLVVLSETDLSLQKRLPMDGLNRYGVSLLGDNYAVSTIHYTFSGECFSTIIIYDKDGNLVGRIKKYDLSEANYVQLGHHHHISVSAGVITVCSPLFNEVTFFNSEGKILGVKNLLQYNLSRPRGVNNDSKGHTLLICDSTDQPTVVCKLTFDRKPKVVMTFTESDYNMYGEPLAVAAKVNVLVVVFQKSIQLYEYQ